MTRRDADRVGHRPYTGHGRIRPTPRAETSGVVPALSPSSVGAGSTIGVVPDGPAPRMFGPTSIAASWASRPGAGTAQSEASAASSAPENTA